MRNGKNKAFTLSFDDGCRQDIRLIKILNKYGLKGTFNLNSGFLGTPATLERNGHTVNFDKVSADEVNDIYRGHEIAVHTLTHPVLCELNECTVIRQVEEDRRALEAICGYKVVGMAYPGGLFDERVVNVIAKNTPIKYSRTVVSTYNFDLQSDLLGFNPTVYYIEVDKLFELAEKFIALKPVKPQLFYVWGHSFEMDADYISWEMFEEFCKLISGRDDIFYGTNRECLL